MLNNFCILQWNINGFFNNYDELSILIKEKSPSFIALQETHLAAGKTATVPNQYFGYFSNLDANSTCKQGIGVLIKKSIHHKQIILQSNLSVLAFEINIGFVFSIVSIYIPPQQNFLPSDIKNIINSIHTPIVLLGDLNAWSPLWGSPRTNSRGKALEEVFLSEDLIVINDGLPTHFSSHASFTHVDVISASASLIPKISSLTLSDLYGSDHFPIVTNIQISRSASFIHKPRFLTHLANWDNFKTISSDFSCKHPLSSNVDQEAEIIAKSIRYGAHYAIPQSRPIKTNRVSPTGQLNSQN